MKKEKESMKSLKDQKNTEKKNEEELHHATGC